MGISESKGFVRNTDPLALPANRKGLEEGPPALEVEMATERQIQETVARCVATVVFYHNSPRTRHSVILMTAEVRATAAGVSEFGLSAIQTEEQILRPVEAELIARYGAETGRLLSREFAKAFGGTAGPIPILSPFAV